MSLGLHVDSEIWGKKIPNLFSRAVLLPNLGAIYCLDLGEQPHLLHLPKDRNKPEMAPCLPLRIFA